MNPWEDISLDDYENHMSLDSVMQLQAMNQIMKEQFEAYDVHSAIVLGVAGGNGLEHIDPAKFRKVYGVDINKEYLNAVADRYSSIEDILECMCLDLTANITMLPKAELVISNLLIEYIGYQAFDAVVHKVDPQYVSCVIQVNTDEKNWVSDSPYIHVFDRLDEIHYQMEQNSLVAMMERAGYKKLLEKTEPLPNGKALIRIDFIRNHL